MSSKGVVRKLYDTGPLCFSSTNTYDGSGTPTTSWAAGVLQPSANAGCWLTSLQQGVTDNDRVGFSIAAESLDISMIINPDTNAGSQGQNVLRCVIVADNECDGAFPTLAEILGNAQQTDNSIVQGWILSHLQPGYFGRFRVLMDEYWSWHSFGASTSYTLTPESNKSWEHRRHFDLHDHRILWDMSDGNAITNARKGHIFAFFFFQTVVVSAGGLPTITLTNPPAIQFMSRIRYKDA